MKEKIALFIVLMIVSLGICGCDKVDDVNIDIAISESSQLPDIITTNTDDEATYDVQVSEEKLAPYLAEDEFIMGAQYEDEEIVFLVGNAAGNVYSYKLGQEKEILLEGMSSSYVAEAVRWWKLGDRYYTVLGRFFNVFQEDGVKAYQVLLADGDRITDMAQTESGRVAAVWYSAETYKTNLVELDTENGEMTSKLALPEHYGIAGGAEDGVIIRDEDGIYTYDLQSGEKVWHLRFENTTYNPLMTKNTAKDFRLTAEGEIMLLGQDFLTNDWYEETISKVSFTETGKTILVYQVNFASSTLKEVVTQFNKENEKYFVYLDERDFSIEYDDYVARTNIELIAGKGADIIDYYAVDNITSLAKKGVFENLEPYIEENNMSKEAFFEGTFRDFETGDGLYGLGFCQSIDAVYMKEDFAKQSDSLEGMLNNMEIYTEDAVFSTLYQRFPSAVLSYFLEMSPDIYGMLDWEKGTCDFENETWNRMLENSMRYGKGEQQPDSEEITMRVTGGTFDSYALEELEAQEREMVPVGFPTEDGMTQKVWIDTVCMNANSEHKEGVWEFMQYLLSSTSQHILAKTDFPVSRSEFETLCRKELANPSVVTIVDYEPVYVSEEHIETVSRILEEAQLPVQKNEEILNIILEEVEDYFSGDKTIEQVTEIIENRVTMYLAENM